MALELYLEEYHNLVVLTLEGAVLSSNAQHLQSAIDLLLENGYSRIILDCQTLVSINSAGLAVLSELVRILTSKKNAGRVVLCHVAPAIQELLQLSGLDQFIDTVPARGDAFDRAMH